jgi:hypothetical protein
MVSCGRRKLLKDALLAARGLHVGFTGECHGATEMPEGDADQTRKPGLRQTQHFVPLVEAQERL